MNLTRIQNLLLFVVLLPLLVYSAQLCYQCVSAMDPECEDEDTLKENFPNQCFTRDPAAKCVVYEYEATGEKAIHIVRGCRNFTDSCGNINNSLKIQHKKVKGCSFCGTDLCNKYILPKSSKNDKIPKHTNNGSNFGFIFSGPFFFSIVPKCIVRLLFVL